MLPGDGATAFTRENMETLARAARFLSRESSYNIPVEDDPDIYDWKNSSRELKEDEIDEADRAGIRRSIRYLAKRNPCVKSALRLYRSYVFGRGFSINLIPRDKESEVTETQRKVMDAVDRAWQDFLEHNRRWWTIREFGHRTWRDGELFTLKVPSNRAEFGIGGIPEVRFIDPEEIDDPTGQQTKGIITKDGDPTQPIAYTRINVTTRELIRAIPASEIWHKKIDVDSNVKRGVTRFLSTIWFAQQHRSVLENETTHRKMQSSMVIHRKVAGGPAAVSSVSDNAKTGETTYPEGTFRREKMRAGMMVTTNRNIEIEFKHPESNFSDASPLIKNLVLQLAAATGWPYYMITGDSTDSSLANALVQESPVVLMIDEERGDFGPELIDIWRWVIGEAVSAKVVNGFGSIDKLLEEFEPSPMFPSIVTRDRMKEVQANNIGIMNGSLSVAEVSRRDGVDPRRMQREREAELNSAAVPIITAQNQDLAQKAANAPANQGDGQNQGDTGKPISHKDKQA